jgi:cold shock CspA family protein
MARGTVTAFDDAAGFGAIRFDGPSDREELPDEPPADGQPREYFFHCTAIADGTRTIDVGASVRFAVVAGRLGRWEASGVAAQ